MVRAATLFICGRQRLILPSIDLCSVACVAQSQQHSEDLYLYAPASARATAATTATGLRLPRMKRRPYSLLEPRGKAACDGLLPACRGSEGSRACPAQGSRSPPLASRLLQCLSLRRKLSQLLRKRVHSRWTAHSWAVTYGRLRHSRRSAATMQHLVSRGSFA